MQLAHALFTRNRDERHGSGQTTTERAGRWIANKLRTFRSETSGSACSRMPAFSCSSVMSRSRGLLLCLSSSCMAMSSHQSRALYYCTTGSGARSLCPLSLRLPGSPRTGRRRSRARQRLAPSLRALLPAPLVPAAARGLGDAPRALHERASGHSSLRLESSAAAGEWSLKSRQDCDP